MEGTALLVISKRPNWEVVGLSPVDQPLGSFPWARNLTGSYIVWVLAQETFEVLAPWESWMSKVRKGMQPALT